MRQLWFSLMWLIMAARVVDLPLPVAPVTSTNPFSWLARVRQIGGQVKLFGVGYLGGEYPEGQADAAPLVGGIDPEAGHAGKAVREVQLLALLELGYLLGAGYGPQNLLRILGHQGPCRLDHLQLAVNPGDGGVAHGQMQVRGPSL